MCNIHSKCCMHCLHAREREALLYCGKRMQVSSRITQLIVDAFHVCPLWRARKKVPYA